MKNWGNLDYVSAWFVKAGLFLKQTSGAAAFVATNSICQGGQVAVLWPLINKLGVRICFAYSSFKWANLAANNAGISVVIVGLSIQAAKTAKLFDVEEDQTSVRNVSHINGYLIPGPPIYVSKESEPISAITKMSFGNHPYFASDLIMPLVDARELIGNDPRAKRFLRPIFGSTEVIKGVPRMCIWIEDPLLEEAEDILEIKRRMDSVRKVRKEKTGDGTAQVLVDAPHRFRDMRSAERNFIAVPQTADHIREQRVPALRTDGQSGYRDIQMFCTL